MPVYRGPWRWPRQHRLKLAILEDGRRVQEIAAAAGLSATAVSGVCVGRLRPTENVRRRLAGALGRPEDELFDDVEVAS
jgi:transcriptional regulator with XRE-family HTH domain